MHPGGTYDSYVFDKSILDLNILRLESNDSCNDCGAPKPDWVSLDFGVLICMQCCGRHRGFGSHITRVKSLKLDNWKDLKVEQRYLLEGGNKRFQDYIESLGGEVGNDVLRGDSTSTRVRTHSGSSWGSAKQLYNSSEILYYREILQARVENRQPRSLYEFLSSNPSGDSSGVLSDGEADDGGAGKEPAPGNVFLKGSLESTKEGSAPWVPDLVCNKCQICERKFSIVTRKHHCRNCGKCVCESCAPAKNTRPIKSMGLHDPVRHCKQCYRSPIVNWDKLTKKSGSRGVDVEDP